MEHLHEHNHYHDTEYVEDQKHHHDDEHTSEHKHYHDPEQKKRQINRLSRIIGHLEHVKKQIDSDAECSDVLMQLSAAKSAINGLGKEIINEHMSHCIVHALEDGDITAVEEFQKAIQKYI